MTRARIEEDLRGLYRDQPDLSGVEARLESWAASHAAAGPARTRSGLRNWAAPVATAAAVAAVTVTIVSLPHSHDGRKGSGSAAGSPAAVIPVASTPVASAASSATESAPVQMATITPQFAAQHLLSLLPHTGKITNLGGTAFDNEVVVTMNWNDGHGVAGIYLTLSYPVAPGTQHLGWGCDPEQPAPVCEKIAGGTEVFTEDSSTYPTRRADDPNSLVVGVLRPDGVQVEITESDGPVNTRSVVTRKSLAYTKAQLLAIDLDPIWNAQITKSAAEAAEHLFTPSPGGYPVTPPLLSTSPTAPGK